VVDFNKAASKPYVPRWLILARQLVNYSCLDGLFCKAASKPYVPRWLILARRLVNREMHVKYVLCGRAAPPPPVKRCLVPAPGAKPGGAGRAMCMAVVIVTCPRTRVRSSTCAAAVVVTCPRTCVCASACAAVAVHVRLCVGGVGDGAGTGGTRNLSYTDSGTACHTLRSSLCGATCHRPPLPTNQSSEPPPKQPTESRRRLCHPWWCRCPWPATWLDWPRSE
jgi:hypothetical protein